MTQSTISPLQQRMLDDMRLRNLHYLTQAGYIRSVRRFVKYLKRSLDTASAEDLRLFQEHLIDRGVSPQTLNAHIVGLRFLFETTLERPDALKRMGKVRVPEKLPFVLSQQDVERLLRVAPSLKARAALSVAYGAGLRAAEVTHLKVTCMD